ncbi:hypothetical protein WH87_04905 [Devosia epidermidihirudinis]|uniref:Chromosomal replication initiator DnaA C-terminal domain-containing protein n=1 Tax=Devosia epidermidihirudinis TaxID=1293439 RepID=A0A0F5QFQ8_9HYPH|nr:helix-turn-helix domain-containing protein [Devosia epidermidihirudinis]KKC39533.1 hypothetical protein WH87_04905 [Devosia epidermidihirudinis]
MNMLITTPDLSSLAGQRQHYAAVRSRLRAAASFSCRTPRQVIAVRILPGHPLFKKPEPPLPMVPVTQESQQRVRDVLDIMSVERPDQPEPGHAQEIIHQVASKHSLTPVEMLSARRSPPLVLARQEAMYRMSKETLLTLGGIGRRMGGRDHTTVLHSIRKHAERMGYFQ